jgi:hypothetical protein
MAVEVIIKCPKCGVVGRRGSKSIKLCRLCYNAHMRAYRLANPEHVIAERKRGREWWQKLRHEVIMAYGGYNCACCGETEPLFLSIDHVFNDGAKHRREIAVTSKGNGKGASSRTLQWLKQNGFPAGFQVLCMNCNMGKQRNGGICPHKANAIRHFRVNSVDGQTG